MNYPQAVQLDYYKHTDKDLYPYSNNYWEETAKKYHITVPFKIIDTSMGLSKCSKCGQTYSGYQNKCSKIVTRHRAQKMYTQYSYDNTYDGYRAVGDVFKNSSYGDMYKVTAVFDEECGAYTAWSLATEFSNQQSFFKFLNWLSSMPEQDPSWFSQFRSAFPEGSVEVIEKRVMISKIQHLEFENQQMKDAIRMLADKMHAAGGALTF